MPALHKQTLINFKTSMTSHVHPDQKYFCPDVQNQELLNVTRYDDDDDIVFHSYTIQRFQWKEVLTTKSADISNNTVKSVLTSLISVFLHIVMYSGWFVYKQHSINTI